MGLFDRFRSAKPSRGHAEPAPVDESPSTWISDGDWKDWGPPLNIVSGESHYQPALQSIAGPPRVAGWLVPCEAELRREADNRYDPDAIAVLIDGKKVGYIDRDACGEIAPVLDQHGANARASGIPALVRGGSDGAPFLGVMLWLNHDDVRAALRGVDWPDLVGRYLYASWPPFDGEGDPSESPARTGVSRTHEKPTAHPAEPRMPPITAHYTEYVEDVEELKRRKENEGAEVLLLALIEKVEEESRKEGVGVAPWYYEQLAIVRRKRGDRQGEVEILERYAAMPKAPGASAPKLLDRLEKARARLAKEG